ncbi:MAG: hypothetical protein ACOY5F_14230 [Pseudomonadota bacterium]
MSATDTPLRTTVAEPVSASTRPITGCADAACPPAWASCPGASGPASASTTWALSVAPSGDIRFARFSAVK